MTTPDFAGILRAAADSVRYGITADQIDAQLAAKVHEFCPSCDGTKRGIRTGGWTECSHSDAPTVGRLLAIGAEAITALAQMEADYASRMHGQIVQANFYQAISRAVHP